MSLWKITDRRGGVGAREKSRGGIIHQGATKAPSDGPSIGQILELIPRSAAPARGDIGILAAYHAVPAFFAAVNLVSNRFAEIEWWVTRKGEGPKGDRVDHPVLELLQNPNAELTGYEWRKLQQSYADLLGESFDVRFDGEGNSYDLLPFPPISMRTESAREGRAWRVRHNNFDKLIPDERVLHTRQSLDLFDPYGRGKGVGRALADEVEISEYAARHEKSEFLNNARPDFIAFLPGADGDATEKFKDDWLKELQGINNKGAGLFLGGPAEAKAQIQEMSRSLKDMLVTDLRDFSDKVIRKTYGVSPELLGEVENANRATSDNAKEIFADNVLAPRLAHAKRGYQRNLMPLFDDSGEYELHHTDPRPQNKAFILSVMEKAPEWAFSRNDWRRLAEQPEVDGGDITRVNPMTPAEPIGAPKEEQHREASGAQKERAPDNIVYLVEYRAGSIAKAEGESEAERIAAALTPDYISPEMSEEYEKQIRAWGEGTLESLDVGPENFQMLNPLIQAEVERFVADDITSINDTTREGVKSLVMQGFDENKSPRELKGDLVKLFSDQLIGDGEIPGWRATTIMRTEMLRASNAGTYQAHKVSGVVDAREWIGTPGEDARSWHGGGDGDQLDGTTVGIDEEWTSPETGATAKYPGGFGDPAEDANCRCTTAAAIDNKAFDAKQKEAIWKAFDEDLQKSEEEFLEALIRAFKGQLEDELIPAINDVLNLSDSDEATA